MKVIPAVLLALAVSSAAAAQPLPPGHSGLNTQGKGAPAAKLPQEARVMSSVDASGYTYIEVSQNKKTLWLAGTKVAVKKGDVIRFDDGMVMTNFKSKSLNRTFPKVTFVNRVLVTNEKE